MATGWLDLFASLFAREVEIFPFCCISLKPNQARDKLQSLLEMENQPKGPLHWDAGQDGQAGRRTLRNSSFC